MNASTGRRDLTGEDGLPDGNMDHLIVNESVSLPFLTASQFMATNADQNVISSNLTGTANQVIVTNQGTATCTLSLPQDIATTSSVEFKNLTLNGLATDTNPAYCLTIDSKTNAVKNTVVSTNATANSVAFRDSSQYQI